jgi:parallel beta-helix repeat protein
MKGKIVPAIMLTLLLTSMLTLAFNIQPVKATGTIYIRADGSIDPPTAPISTVDNITYTFAGNISDSIVIERDSIVVDGAGYTVRGPVSGKGIDLSNRKNVVIREVVVTSFQYGIYVSLSNGINITECTVIGNDGRGIYIRESYNNTLTGNRVTANLYDNIDIELSSNSILAGNNVTGYSTTGIFLNGCSNITMCDNSLASNSYSFNINNCLNITVSRNHVTCGVWAGIGLVDSSNSTIFGNNVTGSSDDYGILLSGSSNTILSSNNVTNNKYGVGLFGVSSISSNDTLTGNLIGGNLYNFGVYGDSSSDFVHSIDTSNLVNGRPIYYFVNQSNFAVNPELYPNVGYLGLVNCANVTVERLNMTHNVNGLVLANTSNSRIATNSVSNNGKGIVVVGSSSNSTFRSNNVTTNDGCGIELNYYSNGNAISENIVTANKQSGITLDRCSNNVLERNKVVSNSGGISLHLSDSNIIVENNVTGNGGFGISLDASSNITMIGNLMNSNGYNFGVTGTWLSHFVHSIDTSNLVNSKPVHYLMNQSNTVVSPETYQVGYLGLVNCNNMTVERLNIANNLNGLLLVGTNRSKIISCSTTNNTGGILVLLGSSNNTFAGNNVSTNSGDGITLRDSSNNTLLGNTVSANKYLDNNGDGIVIANSSNNTVIENNITTNNRHGIFLCTLSSDNNISRNTISANKWYGIQIWYSSKNCIFGNNFTKNNKYGLWIGESSNNRIYHNNFVNNTNQVYVYGSSVNSWDDGYPSGGNYWSDYTGTDVYSGQDQNIPGSDGIGDTPHIIDVNNRDRYPLVTPYVGIHDVAVTSVTPSETVIGVGYSLNINVTAANQGDYAETFNITVYANTTVIQTKTLTLTSGNSTTITFTWNTSGFAKGNCTISAVADTVPGETETEDNNSTDGWVTVTIPGDVDGDFDVTILDVVKITGIYALKQGDLGFNPNSDIDNDGVITILDVVACTTHYGQKYP